MLGSTLVRVLSENRDWMTFGTIRSENVREFFDPVIRKNLISGIDVEQIDSLMNAFVQTRPDVVINCIGLVKQLAEGDNPIHAIPINALLPHKLAKLCELSGSRLIHISTDCVFSGDRGNYVETDISDARDIYGLSKYLGEIAYPNTVTLRTSIIGHELQGSHGLLEWFLAQKDKCLGYKRAFFSGMPTVVLSQLIQQVIIPRSDLTGIYHVAADSISKYDLLNLIAQSYSKKIEIIPDDKVVIDRSLNATKFKENTGYFLPSWREMIDLMHAYK